METSATDAAAGASPSYEAISQGQAVSFDDSWYEITSPDHFWMRWRYRALRRAMKALGIASDRPWRILDVGGGHGVLRRQLEHETPWIVDVADVNVTALASCPVGRGRTMLYDVLERRTGLVGTYDAAILFDVIEHVEHAGPLLAATAAHVRPGGLLLVNVPALQTFYSAFDIVIGHFRRYTRHGLRQEIMQAVDGAILLAASYWGASMLPLLAARHVVLGRNDPTDADRIRLVKRGITSPNRLVDCLLRGLMAVETRCPLSPPIGTSVLAIVRLQDHE